MPETTDLLESPEKVEILSGNDKLSVNNHGALIEELALDGVKILTTVQRGDGKKASTHPCSPIFGSEKLYGLPQHGPMRNDRTIMLKQKDGVTFDYDIKGGKYPYGMRVRQEIRIGNETFFLYTRHINTSNQEIPVNFGEHLYWDAPDGWLGLRVNGVDVTDLVKQNGMIDLLPENEILIPGKPPISLKQTGLNKAVLWAYEDADGNFDQGYVCIEPVEGEPLSGFFGSKESMINAGISRSTSLEISIKKPKSS